MKNIIFNFLYQFGKHLPTCGIPVLLYHSVSDQNSQYAVSPKEFKKQLSWLAAHYQCVSTTDIINWMKDKKILSPNAIAITFDDGYKNNITHAFPILNQFQFTATVFIVTHQKASRKQLGNNNPFLTKKDIRFLVKKGWEIHSHSLSHPKFTRISNQKLKSELINSQNEIFKITRRIPTQISYPKGAYNQKVISTTKKYYQAAWGIKPGFVRRGDNPFALKRIEVKRQTSMIAFKAHLTKTVEWVNTLNPT